MSRTTTSSSYPASFGNVVSANGSCVEQLREGGGDAPRRVAQPVVGGVAAERGEQVADRGLRGDEIDAAGGPRRGGVQRA